MSIITKLSEQTKNRNRINIFVDGEYTFSVCKKSASTLLVGQSFSAEDVLWLRAADEQESAYQTALRLLANRDHSEKELSDKLKLRKFSQDAVDGVVARLTHENFLNERRFSEEWVRSRDLFRPRSRRAIQYELRQKGIAEDLILSAVSELSDLENARREAQKNEYRYNGLDRTKFREKLSAFLIRKGYGFEAVKCVINEMLHERDDRQNT